MSGLGEELAGLAFAVALAAAGAWWMIQLLGLGH